MKFPQPVQHPSRHAFILLGIGAVVPALAAWLASVGNPLDYLRYELPPGQALYIFSKLLGLVALAWLWLQCLTALAQRSPALAALRPGLPSHRRLGLSILSVVLLHALLFVLAASLRTGKPALALLLPLPSQGYYGLHLSFGAMALWLLALGVIAGLSRVRTSRGWRWVHWAWLPALVLIALHGWGIGSETRFGGLGYLYSIMALSLVTVALLRLSIALTRNSGK